MKVRIVASLFLVFVAVMFAGCATVMTLHRAEDFHETNGGIVEPKPWHYALLPLSIPFDIATFPLQLPFWGNVITEERDTKK